MLLNQKYTKVYDFASVYKLLDYGFSFVSVSCVASDSLFYLKRDKNIVERRANTEKVKHLTSAVQQPLERTHELFECDEGKKGS